MSTPGQPASIATRVRIDRLQLLYRMSFPAVSFGLLVSCLLAAALWQQAERSRIEIWLAMVFGTTLIRAALFIGYRRVQPSGEAILAWEKPYVATLLLASLTWGAGAVWIMPANSAFHQAVTCYFLMGMAGGAALMYSVVRGMVIATLFALLEPVTA